MRHRLGYLKGQCRASILIPFPAKDILQPMPSAIGTHTDLVTVRNAHCWDEPGHIKGAFIEKEK
jgi:hypothetical protein